MYTKSTKPERTNPSSSGLRRPLESIAPRPASIEPQAYTHDDSSVRRRGGTDGRDVHHPGEAPSPVLRAGLGETRRPSRGRARHDRCPRPRGPAGDRLARRRTPRSLRRRVEGRLHEAARREPRPQGDEGHGAHRRRAEPRTGRGQEGDGPRHPEGEGHRGRHRRGAELESLRDRGVLHAHGARAQPDRREHDERRAARRADVRPHLRARHEPDQPCGTRDEGERVRPRHGDVDRAAGQGRGLQPPREADPARLGGRRDGTEFDGPRAGAEGTRDPTRRRPPPARRGGRGPRRAQGLRPRPDGRRPLRRVERRGDGAAGLRRREAARRRAFLHGPRPERVPAARRIPGGHGPTRARVEREPESRGPGSDLRARREELCPDGDAPQGRNPPRSEGGGGAEENRERPGHPLARVNARAGCRGVRTGETTRRLNTFDVTNLVVGAIIGADVYVATAIGARLVGPASLVVWVVAGLMAGVIALSFAYCVMFLPKVGGPYAYVKAVSGPFPGFMVGWGLLLAEWFSLAVFPVAFTQYFVALVPGIDDLGRALLKAVFIAIVLGTRAPTRPATINVFLQSSEL